MEGDASIVGGAKWHALLHGIVVWVGRKSITQNPPRKTRYRSSGDSRGSSHLHIPVAAHLGFGGVRRVIWCGFGKASGNPRNSRKRIASQWVRVMFGRLSHTD
jgi:hypothetical protein